MKCALSALAMACLATAAGAQTAAGLTEAVQKALANNPDVTARLNALQAAANEADVARGGFYPRIDLGASVGRDQDRITSRTPDSQSLTRHGLALSASQMLWDGLATRKEVERLGHARMVRYFEFLSASEDTALEAARAYLDVLRFRKLVQLAEDNYVQHKYAADQLQSKFKAGVGRGVDAEQSNARLALAESNLTTEIANLHDVSARFLRIVGEAPGPRLNVPAGLERGLQPANTDHVNQALARNPAISAAVENLRAVQAQAEGQESRFQPRVEARVRSGVGKNFDGVLNQKRDTAAELVMNWNLYNGGSDRARVRQYADLINQAADQRDKACRDVRQTSAIAHNDIRKLKDQLVALDRNVLAIEKARDAYRQQFDIGQRSLLDLLNAENELYTARRAYANAEHDLQLAYARTQAVRHMLVSTLGLTQEGAAPELAKDWQAEDEAAQRCPVVSVEPTGTPREELDARARRLAVPAVATAAVTAPTVPTAAPVAPKADAAAVATVTQRLQDWAAAWMAKDANRYLGFYAPEFAPARTTPAQWTANRRRMLSKSGPIEVKLGQVQVAPEGDTVVTRFEQSYRSNDFSDQTAKTLTWRLQGGAWVIVRESNR
ncbi:hypothetical protein DEH84_11660 [Aquabacterium olei]|uniref:Cds6 C-terminal domain-containing protein n=2 Tax=Aquabacterium olei TaxID=1296669 RepID=A0A2U8FT69_9BURK|nr:hypothetical protein DEH84_11660 [Aquabacterium olei]